MTGYKEVRREHLEAGQKQRITTFKATQLIWLVFGLLEAALGLRVLFKLIAVNPGNPFASLLYQVTTIFLAPFATLTRSPAAGNSVFEISTIIAMTIYLLIAWALERMVYVLFYRPREAASIEQTIIEEHTTPPTSKDRENQ